MALLYAAAMTRRVKSWKDPSGFPRKPFSSPKVVDSLLEATVNYAAQKLLSSLCNFGIL